MTNEPNDALKQPMSVGDWIITFIVMAVPLVNIVMLFVWAFSSNTNINRVNWAKASLIMLAAVFVFYILVIVVLFGTGVFGNNY